MVQFKRNLRSKQSDEDKSEDKSNTTSVSISKHDHRATNKKISKKTVLGFSLPKVLTILVGVALLAIFAQEPDTSTPPTTTTTGQSVRNRPTDTNLRKVQQRPTIENTEKTDTGVKEVEKVVVQENNNEEVKITEEKEGMENDGETKVVITEEVKDDTAEKEDPKAKVEVKDDTAEKEDLKAKVEVKDDTAEKEDLKAKVEVKDDTAKKEDLKAKVEVKDDTAKKEEPKEEVKDKEELGKNKETVKQWDSDKSVVIGLATGYGLNVFQIFVGSLRATGYRGHIILGIAKDAPDIVRDYLESQNVTMKEVVIMSGEKCTYYGHLQNTGEISTKQKCSEEYPDYKIQWGRFPLAKKWLLECSDCTSGVMLTDVRDAYFQSNPFTYKYGNKELKELPRIMTFEEIFPNVTNSHWLVNMPVDDCRKTKMFSEKNTSTPMLCSGSTMGSREGIIDYVDAMVKEMDYWKASDDCRSDMPGDDQSIHNYLYYTDQLPGAVAIPHRTGPIHVAGVQAALIKIPESAKPSKEEEDDEEEDEEEEDEEEEDQEKDDKKEGDKEEEEEEDDWHNWLKSEHDGLFDPKTGHILNLDGQPSPQVHQFDRYPWPEITKYLAQKSKEWNTFTLK